MSAALGSSEMCQDCGTREAAIWPEGDQRAGQTVTLGPQALCSTCYDRIVTPIYKRAPAKRGEHLHQGKGDAPDTAEPAADDCRRAVLLDDEWWESRTALSHIRQAARSRRVAPTGVLASVLARVAAFTPPGCCVPAFVGGTVTLSTYVALIGDTAHGKSAQERVAAELLPHQPTRATGPLPLGSGEGAVDAFLERPSKRESEQAYDGALFTLDEGRVLTDLGQRSGATIVPTLCTMWTGGNPGRANASADTRRSLAPGEYTVGLVSLWQPTKMGPLFDDIDGGLPGRFVFLALTDPDAPEHTPVWPGPLDWTPPDTDDAAPLAFPNEVHATVDAEHHARLTGQRHDADPIDGHRTLCRLKLAGLLALLDQRTTVTLDDWTLTARLMAASRATRNEVRAKLQHEHERRRHASNTAAADREVTKLDAIEKRALLAATNAIGNKAHRKHGKVLPKRELTQAIKGSDRKIVGVDAAIDEAERLGYIVAAEGGWTAGESRPA